MKMSRFALSASIAALLAIGAALAQSSPGFVTGQVPSSTQWNAAFSAHQDYNPALTAFATNCASHNVGCITNLGGVTGTPSSTTYLRGDMTWATVVGGVTSVFGRTGAVVAASGDYTFAQIASTPTTISGYGISDAVSLTGTQTLTNKTFVAPVLGTVAAGSVLTLATGLPVSTGLSGLGTNVATFLATPSSANLIAALTDETGTGSAVFSASPALTGVPTAPTAAANTNTTQLATTAFVIGQGYPSLSPATGNVTGHIVTMSNTTTGLTDSGTALSALAMNGTGAVLTSNPTLTAAQYNQNCPIYTVNATGLNIQMPAASTLQTNGGCLFVSNPSAFSVNVTPNAADNINGGTSGAALSIPAGAFRLVTTDGVNELFIPTGSASVAGANPTATIGASAVNGSATTFMRSDAAPALPSTLPALNGSLLTALNASNLSTGSVSAALLPLATTGAFGAVKPDGTTITISGGVISAVGGGSGCTVAGTIGQAVYNNGSTGCSSSAATFSSGGGLILPAAGAASTPGLLVSGAPFAGTGTTSTPQLYINNGTAPTTFNTSGTMFGINAPSAFAGNLVDFHVNGGPSVFNVSAAGALGLGAGLSASTITASSTIAAGASATIGWTGRAVMTSTANGFLQFGALDNASPAGYLISNQSGSGTNIAGQNMTIRGSLGTGNASSADVIFQTGGAIAGSGTTQATGTEALRIKGVTQEVQFNAPARLKGYTVAGLPTGNTGDLAYVSDGNAACVYGTTPIGGGSTVCRVFYNGTGWVE